MQQQHKQAAHDLLSAFRSSGTTPSLCAPPWDVYNPNLSRFYETCCMKIDSDGGGGGVGLQVKIGGGGGGGVGLQVGVRVGWWWFGVQV